MKIHIDIGHPAHVHYFKNLMKILTTRGHTISISARNKEVIKGLLKAYSIDFFDRGSGYDSILGKLYYTCKADYLLYRKCFKFKPDLFLSFGSPYAAHVAKMLNKPHIAADDTEHARLTILSYVPFSDSILTPESFKRSFGNKQIRFKGFMELCYLHPKYFQPDINILSQLQIEPSAKYILIRFISWKAGHDRGILGLNLKDKISLVTELSKNYKVFISSEGDLEEELQAYKLDIPAEKIHDVLYYASLYIGEGATMASESAVLGIPAIYINPLTAGTLNEQEKKYELVFQLKNLGEVKRKAIEILDIPDADKIFQKLRLKLLEDNIDVTSFLIWFVENYPLSHEIIKKDPGFQNKFKHNESKSPN